VRPVRDYITTRALPSRGRQMIWLIISQPAALTSALASDIADVVGLQSCSQTTNLGLLRCLLQCTCPPTTAFELSLPAVNRQTIDGPVSHRLQTDPVSYALCRISSIRLQNRHVLGREPQ
jgi:hypothetical protein